MNKTLILLLCLFVFCNESLHAQQQYGTELQDLSGTWTFRLDPAKVGESEFWFNQSLTEGISLPGSTDENGVGTVASKPELTRLTRERTFYGPAWYQKIIEIPSSWQGKHVELLLERVMWESKVWVDDHFIGKQESLCASHKYDMSDFISPGRHRITIRIDNRYRYNIGDASSGRMGSPLWTMAVTDESQTTWNGVIGRMEISVSDAVWIERFEVYPDVSKKQTRVVAIVCNRPGVVAEGEVSVSASGPNHNMGSATVPFRTKGPESPVLEGEHAVLLSQVTGSFYTQSAETRVEIMLPFDDDVRRWDEFSPEQYTLKIILSANDRDKKYRDEKTGNFGVREFVADGRQFRLNGRAMFLRGNQDNCIHPLTGYPPMDVRYWLKFLQTYKDYGLNHIRFHSWCPPDAAFTAADQLGMILQIEAPMWDGYGDVGKLPDRAAFIRFEAERILDEYGNHPSFCMFSLGNELGPGTEYYLQYMVEVLRQRDNRHLYTCASAPASNLRNDDYLVGANGVTGDWACSISETCFRGLKQWKGQNAGDVRHQIESLTRPLIAHEIGQHTSFPDFYSWFNEKKYTGPLKAHYIDIFKKQFEKNHPSQLGPQYARASGQLQLLLYKAEIEIMLRTPNLSGFHLNGLSDYPGEGVALIGILDAFLDSKGIASPETFRQFCSETVPLTRLRKQTWTAGESFEVPAEVRHHGPTNLIKALWRWKISDKNGKTLKEGNLGAHDIPTGELSTLGVIKTNLPEFSTSQELTLTVWMEKSNVLNAWLFWVYPDVTSDPAVTPPGIMIADEWNDDVKNALNSGKKVLLFPTKESVAKYMDADFFPVFWSKDATSKSVGSMGLYCDPAHPSFRDFPTRSHSDWQWYDLLTNSYTLNINDLPFEFEPVVHLIDFFKTNDRLAMVLEAKVGKGKLLVCTLNLGHASNRTQAQKQMVKSLMNYANSKAFRPGRSLTIEMLNKIL